MRVEFYRPAPPPPADRPDAEAPPPTLVGTATWSNDEPVDRTATVTAESELRCLGMTFWDFRPLVETNGKIAWKLLQSLAKQMQGR